MADLHEIWKSLYEDNTNNKSDDGEGLDKVQPKALKKDFKDRKDKDIDNDGDVDDSDEYIDNKRKTVSKAIKKDKKQSDAEIEVEEATEYVRVMKNGIRKSVPAATLKAYVSKGWEEVTESTDLDESYSLTEATKSKNMIYVGLPDDYLDPFVWKHEVYINGKKVTSGGDFKLDGKSFRSVDAFKRALAKKYNVSDSSFDLYKFDDNGKNPTLYSKGTAPRPNLKESRQLKNPKTESVDLDEAKMENSEVLSAAKRLAANGKDAKAKSFGQGLVDFYKKNDSFTPDQVAGLQNIMKNAGFQLAKESLGEMKQAKRKTTVGDEGHMPNAAPNDKRAFREHPIKIDDTDEKGHQDSMKAGSKKAKLAPPRRGDNTVREFAEFLDGIQLDESFEGKEIADLIEKSYRKYFPKGMFYSGKKHLGGGGFNFTLGLIGDKKDYPNGIEHNDPMRHTFGVTVKGDGFEVTQSSGSLSVNPPEKSFMAMSSVKTKFRKVVGDEKKIVAGMDRFFSRLKSIVNDNKDNIYGADKIRKYIGS